MASRKAPKKFTEKMDKKTIEEQTVQATMNSQYSLFIPCQTGKTMYVRNPVTQKIRHLDVTKDSFKESITELVNLGLEVKIRKDFQELVEAVDESWADVLAQLETDGIIGNKSTEE